MSENVEIFIEVCRDGAVIPSYANAGDAGMDVYAAEEVIINPGQTVVVPTGIKLAIPVGYEIQVRPRSGISLNTPIRLSNSPGTIDSGYRGELGILMTNTSHIFEEEPSGLYEIDSKGNKKGSYIIRKGNRVAQIVLQKVPVIKFTAVNSVDNIGEDRGGGFGSTGIK